MHHNTFSEAISPPKSGSPQTPPISQGDVFMLNSPRTSLTPGFLIRGTQNPYKAQVAPSMSFKSFVPQHNQYGLQQPNFYQHNFYPHYNSTLQSQQHQYSYHHRPQSSISSSSSANSSLDDPSHHHVQAISPTQLLPPFLDQVTQPKNQHSEPESPSATQYSGLSEPFEYKEEVPSAPFSGISPAVLVGMSPIVGSSSPPVTAVIPGSPMVSPTTGLLMCSPQYIACLSPLEVLRLVSQSLSLGTVVIPPSPSEMLQSPRSNSNEPMRQWRGINIEGIPSRKTYSELIGELNLPTIEFAHLSTDYSKGAARLELRFLNYNDALLFYAECLMNPVECDGKELSVSWALLPPVPTTLEQSIRMGATRLIKIVFNAPQMDPSTITTRLQEELSKVGPIESIQFSTEGGTMIFTVCFATLDAAICGISLARSVWPSASEIKYVAEREPQSHKLEEQAALLYLGESPYETKRISKYKREDVSEALTYQYLAAVLTAQIRGSTDNTGNRCICISRLPSNTKLLDVCNIVRGGMLESVRIFEDLNVCFVVFVEPTAAVRFWANYQMKRLNVNGERVRVGWGRTSGPLASELKQVIDEGVTRNLCLKWQTKSDPLLKQGYHSEEQRKGFLENIFSPFGTIEQVRIAPEVSCTFISFTDIKNTIQAVSWARESGKFSEFSVQYGKDRCANLPRTSEKSNEATLIQFLRRSLLRSLNNSNRAFGAPGSPGFVEN